MAKVILMSLVLLLLWCKLQAQISSSTSAGVNIVSPIGTSKKSEMSFGRFLSLGTQTGEIILTPFHKLSINGSIEMVSKKERAHAVTITILNRMNNYNILLPPDCLIVRKDGDETMRLCQFNIHTSPSTREKELSETVTIGATLIVNPQQAAGEYFPVTPFNVIINYN